MERYYQPMAAVDLGAFAGPFCSLNRPRGPVLCTADVVQVAYLAGFGCLKFSCPSLPRGANYWPSIIIQRLVVTRKSEM